jgi:ferredoxin
VADSSTRVGFAVVAAILHIDRVSDIDRVNDDDDGTPRLFARIRRQDCCGSGDCIALAPTVFALDSKNKAIVLDERTVSAQVLREAAEGCPCSAIVLEDEDGNERFP